MSTLNKTPLYNLQHASGAKFIPFAGYEMAIQFTSGIIKEHLHCRNHVGLFDISHMGQCLITGPTVAEELEKLTPGNITHLKKGQQRYVVLTNEMGGIIDDMIITRRKSDYLLIVNAACKEKDYAHLTLNLSDQCKIEILQNQALLALQGPKSAQIMAQLSVAASKLSFMQSCHTQIAEMECFISRCGYTGEDGFEISISNHNAEKLAKCLLAFSPVKLIGLGARDTLRLEAGLALYGQELNEMISPIEAGLKWTLRKDACNFPGAATIQHQVESGAEKKRVGLMVEGKVPIRQNTPLFDSQNNNIGYVTSGNFSPSLKKPIALALIKNSYKEPGVFAKVRNRIITLTLTQPPFIPHRYHRS